MIFGLLMVFLILAAQYERWSLPLAVITAVPFAIFGALLATDLRGLTNDVYFQIGLVTLIGLAAKNAILIVEFAVLQREEGKSAIEAAAEAARLRFRPIVMTSLAFILVWSRWQSALVQVRQAVTRSVPALSVVCWLRPSSRPSSFRCSIA